MTLDLYVFLFTLAVLIIMPVHAFISAYLYFKWQYELDLRKTYEQQMEFWMERSCETSDMLDAHHAALTELTEARYDQEVVSLGGAERAMKAYEEYKR